MKSHSHSGPFRRSAFRRRRDTHGTTGWITLLFLYSRTHHHRRHLLTYRFVWGSEEINPIPKDPKREISVDDFSTQNNSPIEKNKRRKRARAKQWRETEREKITTTCCLSFVSRILLVVVLHAFVCSASESRGACVAPVCCLNSSVCLYACMAV